jgi:hypothetical protein
MQPDHVRNAVHACACTDLYIAASVCVSASPITVVGTSNSGYLACLLLFRVQHDAGNAA